MWRGFTGETERQRDEARRREKNERQRADRERERANEEAWKAEEERSRRAKCELDAFNANNQSIIHKREKVEAEEKASALQLENERSKEAARRALEQAKADRIGKEKAQQQAQAAEEERRKMEDELQSQTEKTESETKERIKMMIEAEKDKETWIKQKEILQSDNKALSQAKKELLSEKSDRERIEEKQKEFQWGKQETEWTEEEASRLRKFITEDTSDEEGNKITLRILVVGPTGHGKSSFCNGCRSAIKTNPIPSAYYPVGTLGTSFTKHFHAAPYGETWIIDMAGFMESTEAESESIVEIATGKVPFNAKMLDSFKVDPDKMSVNFPEPGENDVSCVVIVLKYDAELGPQQTRQVRVIMEQSGEGLVSYHLVLTHLDECDPQFKNTDNLRHIYESAKVQAAVKSMSEETGIPPFAISFVKNYTTEKTTNINITLQHLKVLESIISYGLDQNQKRLDQQKQEEHYNVPNIKRGKGKYLKEKEKKNVGEDTNGNAPSSDLDRKIPLFALLVAVIYMLFLFRFG